jgi:hypothetical protein
MASPRGPRQGQGGTPCVDADDQFRTVFRSPIQKKRANDNTELAFFNGSWQVPEGTNARFRVHLFFYYYAAGSQTQVVGRVRGLLEVYRHKLNASNSFPLGSEGDAGWCQRNYHGL